MIKSIKKIKFGGYKIAAIAVAVLLWFYVLQVQNPITEQVYNVSLETRNLASDLVLSEQNYQIQVRVQAPKQFLESSTAKDVEVYADFAGMEAGQNQVKVKISLPEQMELVSINPESVTVNIEKLKTKSFPLEVELADSPAVGYMALDPILAPNQISISGSSNYLERISKVYVPVSLLDINSSYHRKVTIEAIDEKGNILTPWVNIAPEYADVFIPIVQEQPEKLLPINVSILGSPAPGYQLSRIIVEPSFIKVFGDIDELQQLNYLQTAPLNISNAKKPINATVDLIVEDSFSTANIKEVTVYLQIEKVEHKTFNKLFIYNQNTGPGLEAKIKSDNVNVTVYGPLTTIEDMVEADIIPYVDCRDLTAGTYSLPIKLDLPPNVKSQKITPQKVDVIIKEKI
ncbi:MAG: YbbR-like domain-containing protein [Bacillota bacterium]